jgi:DNA repair exonuclease SbcCD ATPase subunit
MVDHEQTMPDLVERLEPARIERLRQIAEAVPVHGKWYTANELRKHRAMQPEDGAFIAECDPPTVLALLAEITRLRTELASTQKQLGECSGGYQTLERELASEREHGKRLSFVVNEQEERNNALRARVETLEGALRKALPVVDHYAFDRFSDEGKLARGLLPVLEAVIPPEYDNHHTALKESPDHE